MVRISIVALTMLVGCGQDSKQTGKPTVDAAEEEAAPEIGQQPSQQSGGNFEIQHGTSSDTDADLTVSILLAGKSLPTCSSEIEGKTYYIQDERVFKFCADSHEWTIVDLTGPRGATGAAGTPGINGTGVTIACYDGNGAKIGYPVPGSNCSERIFLVEGVIGNLNLNDSPGEIDGQMGCGFELANCVGNCVTTVNSGHFGRIDEILFGGHGYPIFKVSSTATKQASMVVQSQLGLGGGGTSVCNNFAPTTWSDVYVAEPYDLIQSTPLALAIYPDFDE
jgi:hypothetical protein